MSTIDWIVMLGTTFLIVGYGAWKNRKVKDIKGYLLADNDLKWWTIGLSIMATQASAITFLSTPGQAFDDGMRFVQFYFGVPIAMVVIALVAVPIYRRLNVYTAYEYLEGRFDLKTRTFTAFLFLVQRGLAAGLTIYAPAIILSTLLGWDINLTCVAIGLVVMVYTVSGGTKAVSQTQQQQMAIILIGMLIAGVLMVFKLPEDISFGKALAIAGSLGKLNVITLPDSPSSFFTDKFNLLSGLMAGTFLMLSYFGTDQSQVQRYLGGKSVSEIRIGLMFNGIFKVPMQFLILFIGVMMFVFYQFNSAPLFFNPVVAEEVRASEYGPQYDSMEVAYQALRVQRAEEIRTYLSNETEDQKVLIQGLQAEGDTLRSRAKKLIKQANPDADLNDLDRIFLTFILNQLPVGLIGLLMAVIIAAALSSTAAELNALATTTMVDIYKRRFRPHSSPAYELRVSRGLTMFWGILAIIFALVLNELGNLIQAVNLLGSLFYGTILGIFVLAFFFKSIKGTATFIAAIIGEILVISVYLLPMYFEHAFAWLNIGFLWYNLIGCVAVVLFGLLFQAILPKSSDS